MRANDRRSGGQSYDKQPLLIYGAGGWIGHPALATAELARALTEHAVELR